MLYVLIKVFLELLFPTLSTAVEVVLGSKILNINLIFKWFIFWGMGVAPFIAGIKQAFDPGFTLEKIFLITNRDCFIIVQELGFANISLGLIGMGSLFVPSWRMPAVVANGLFLGLAGMMHVIKGPASLHEYIALASDFMRCTIAVAYILKA